MPRLTETDGLTGLQRDVAYLIGRHGTAEQKATFLPRMATGQIRAAFSMSEPGLGSDVAAIRTTARPDDGGDYLISGQKMWLTNGASANLVALLARDAPMLLIGEGTAEIQKMIVGRRLLERFAAG